jgi:hypothetical protein
MVKFREVATKGTKSTNVGERARQFTTFVLFVPFVAKKL